ncbi:phospholipase D family protein [Bacillus solimangrovi]|uniref:Phospholipase n=1 Tax=Bacillus solimangrovi TaxID=1305675 RepID=A0A1E5LFH9_9BACI|nr:phospholipase D family protein [Bacillus solimangrovi]OEH92845.1 phospholipase [Bacillus solimangrovi]
MSVLKKINRKLKILKFVTLFIVVFALLTGIYGMAKPLPEGISYLGKEHVVADIDFLYDLTYMQDGKQIREQQIFERVFETIEEAEQFIVVDMFLFNDDYERMAIQVESAESKTNQVQFPNISEQLTNTLISKKKSAPNVKIIVITDPINTFYSSYDSKFISDLEANGIDVVYTDLKKLRDSNPLYSGFWRSYLQWWGTSDDGWLTNPFSPDSPEVTVRSYLNLLNFKANHRKVLVTEKQGLITSANPHDASGYHSNIAFIVKGSILQDLLESEMAIIRFSGEDVPNIQIPNNVNENDGLKVQLLTEGKIRQEMLDVIKATEADDIINIGVFYLSERTLIKELINSANRGVTVNVVLDPNKDAFGRQKNGIPNRQVAYELTKKSDGKINIRWYNTNGEQFHTKMMFVQSGDQATAFAGSANFTRRNIRDYNLETDFKITIPKTHPLETELDNYFERIWNNDSGTYTVDYEQYQDHSKFKYMLYRFQEWSGISTF